MKVSESNSQGLEYSRELDERMKKQTAAKEAEIENVKQLYDKKIEASKANGEERYINSLKKNDDMIIGASHDYEEKLKGYKENLDRTQENIAKEELALKSEHDEKTQSAKDQYLSNMQDKYRNAKENQEMIQGQVKNAVQMIADKARAEKNHMETSSRTEMRSLANEYNQKGIDEQRDFKAKLLADVKAHEEEARIQKEELKKVSDSDMQKSKRLESEKMKIQKDELTFLDKHQKDMLAQKQADFKVRYENMIKEHDTILSQLKSHLDTDIKKMIEQTSGQKRIIANRMDDQFYKVETLNPSIAETEKDYIVSLKIPEYEKENVHLSVHDREVKMTLTRKYSETLEAQDGSSNRSTRNELYSKEFNSKDLLNSKAISQKYENGILSYKIQKL